MLDGPAVRDELARLPGVLSAVQPSASDLDAATLDQLVRMRLAAIPTDQTSTTGSFRTA